MESNKQIIDKPLFRPNNPNQRQTGFTFPNIETAQTPLSSANSNDLYRLNASQFQSVSTPGVSNSEPKGPLVEFQEYEFSGNQQQSREQRQKSITGAKNLTIKIQDSFPFRQQSEYIPKPKLPQNQMQYQKRKNLTLKIDEQQNDNDNYEQQPKKTHRESNYQSQRLIIQSSSLQHSSSESVSQDSSMRNQDRKSEIMLLEPLTNQEPLNLRNLEQGHENKSKVQNFFAKNCEGSYQAQAYSSAQLSSHRSSSSSVGKSDRQYLSQIQKLTTRVLQVEEKLFYYEDYNSKLLRENQTKEHTIEESFKQIALLNTLLKKKEELAEQRRQKIDVLMCRLTQLEKEKELLSHTNSNSRPLEVKIEKQEFKLKQKDSQIKQLQKKNQKVMSINKVLQKQLRDNEKKLIEMEKEMHRTTCNTFYENVTRLKESSMKLRESSKENHHMNVSTSQNPNHIVHGPIQPQSYARKSLEVKKNSQSSANVAKSQRTNSSNINLLAKKLAHGK